VDTRSTRAPSLAFWREFGEEPDYDDRVVFLAERGPLFEEEICALADARRRKHIDTGVEHTDPEAVALYERVTEALKATRTARSPHPSPSR
jgi:hypothetical protein